jgi:hypothetical protein
MTQQPDRQLDPSLPNAARMQAIGDLLALRFFRDGVDDLLFRKTILVHANLRAGWRPRCPG